MMSAFSDFHTYLYIQINKVTILNHSPKHSLFYVGTAAERDP